MRRFLKWSALAAVVAVAVAAVLYQWFGLRLVMSGSGIPFPRFVRAAATHARAIERHREAQRAASPAEGVVLGDQGVVPGLRQTGTTPSLPYWTSFRGPDRDGHYRERPILTAWPASGLTPMWKQPVGGGYASYVVAGGRAFTIEQRGSNEVVAAYDVMTGRELWKSTWPGAFKESMGGDGPRATPTWADGFVYSLGALGELRCLDDATGRVVWRTNILQDNAATNLQWAMAASPLVVDEMVIVLPGGSAGRSVAAYNKRTGAPVWTSLDDRQAYVAPMLATLAGTRQVVVVSASRMVGLTLEDGAVLWEYPWVTQYDINAAQPLIVGDNRVFISSAYGVGGAVLEIAKAGDRYAAREIWKNIRLKNKYSGSVLHEGFIYGLDEAILACVDAATGELKWKGGRYGYGQVLLASGHLIVLSETGELALVTATPAAHQEVARFQVLDGQTWNVPAISGGILLVPNAVEMAAFDLRTSRH